MIRIWTIERLLSELRRKASLRARASQLVLPGFENLPQSISKREGGRKKLLNATLRDLVDYKESLYRTWKGSKKREQVERLITLMRGHKLQGIRVAEVLALEGIQPKLPE